MKHHNYSYDYLRAFSAIMIVLCHIFMGFGINAEIGYYLGGTYVDVFLLLSAYLLGLSSRNKIANQPWQFMKKRCGRLVPTYYSFLTITFLLILTLIGSDALSSKQIIGHYLFLNWFYPSSRIESIPLPQIGHLWFMSCIMLGYFIVVVCSLILKRFPSLNNKNNWFFYFSLWALISTFITMRVRFAVYPCTVVLAFVLLFFKGREIMDYVRKLRPAILISLLVICNMGGGNILPLRWL